MTNIGHDLSRAEMPLARKSFDCRFIRGLARGNAMAVLDRIPDAGLSAAFRGL